MSRRRLAVADVCGRLVTTGDVEPVEKVCDGADLADAVVQGGLVVTGLEVFADDRFAAAASARGSSVDCAEG